jgi:hypothetical protein
LDDWLATQKTGNSDVAWRAHYGFARERIAALHDDPAAIRALPALTVPPGSPIGDGLAQY